MIIELGEWLPDVQAVNNPGLISGNTLKPTAQGYSTFYAANDISSASPTSDAALGGIGCESGGAYKDYFGTTDNLFRVTWNGTNLVAANVSKSADVYNTNVNEYWDFTQFGTSVYAVNGGDGTGDTMQSLVITSGSNFADVALNQPEASTITSARDFIIVGDTWDADGHRPGRVRWSGFGGTDWTVNASTQADFQDMETDAGSVRRVLGGPDVFVVTDRAVYIMTYQGPPTIWRFDQLANVGTNYGHSAVRDGNYLYMWGISGPVRIGRDGSIKWIARGKCENFLRKLVQSETSDYYAIGFIDRDNEAVGWVIADRSSPQSTNATDTAYYYFPEYDRWMPVFMGTKINGGYPWRTKVFGSSPTGKTKGAEVDSIIWHGMTDPVGSNDNYLWSRSVPGFSGGASGSYEKWEATTGAIPINQGSRTLISEVRVLGDRFATGTDTVVKVATVNDIDNEPISGWSYTTFSENTAADTYQGLAEGRYFSFSVGDAALNTTGRVNVNSFEIPPQAIARTGRY